MCGRVRLSSDVEKLIEVFSIPPSRPAPNIAASWNVAPTDPLPVVRYDGKAGERSLDVLRWGLVPFWAKDIKVGFANINAKAEGIDTKPGLPRGVRAPALPGAGRQLLRMEKDRDRQAALRDRACRSRHHGARGLVGELALAGRRADPQLRDRHDGAERIVRRASQPHARGPEARGVAGMARRGTGRRAASSRRCWPPTLPTT